MKLTDKGEVAYINHEKLKDNFFTLVEDLLKNEEEEDVEYLSIFLEKLNNKIQH